MANFIPKTSIGFKSLLLGLLVLFSAMAHAIYPDQIGGTQYATGHLAAAMKMRKEAYKIAAAMGWTEEKVKPLYELVEELMTVPRSQFAERLLILPEADRKAFTELVTRIQEKVSKKSPMLFMIGAERAVATDGHHGVRSLVKLTEILEESNTHWPQKVREVLASMGRIKENGSLVIKIPFQKPKVIATLPGDARASKIMRTILAHEMGLWEQSSDDKLAKKYFGPKNSKNASKKELTYLARQLGIINGPTGVTFIPVTALPDSPNRTLLGLYFESRGFKESDVAYRTYVEFYVGDEVKNLALEDPDRFPHLLKFLDSSTPVSEQKIILNQAMTELDEMFALKKKLTKTTIALTSKGSSELEAIIGRIRQAHCLKLIEQGAGF